MARVLTPKYRLRNRTSSKARLFAPKVLFDELAELVRRHKEAGGEGLGELFPRRIERDVFVDEDVGVIDDGTVGAVHEVVAVEVGGDERLEPGGLVGVDQGEGGLPLLVKDENAGDPGLLGEASGGRCGSR